MATIKDMMEKTALDITKNLQKQREAEMLVQTDAVNRMTLQINAMTKAQIDGKAETQPSPFETPRAERPQDLAYKQILTSSKKKTEVEDTHSTPAVHAKQSSSDQTIHELVKLMNTTLKQTKSKETTTDLPKFTGKDAQWERWYELLRSYFQAKEWL